MIDAASWVNLMIKNKRVIGIIAAAGSGRRMGSIGKNKVYLELGGMPILARTIAAFEACPLVDELFVAVRRDELSYCRKEILKRFGFQKVARLIPGGRERQETVAAALDEILEDDGIVFVHDGARPLIDQETIQKLLEGILEHGAAVVGVPVKDTIKIAEADFIQETPDRNILWAMQTPQGAEIKILKAAMENAKAEGFYGTDEAVLLEKISKKVFIVTGKYDNIKITTSEDLVIGEALLQKLCEERKEAETALRVGIGYDVHRLVPDLRLVLGGVVIPWDQGLEGHSDADVLIHAVMDALLGACGMGDIGVHFPDTDETYRGISSMKLLREVNRKIRSVFFEVENIDATIIAQAPKLLPYMDEMRQNIAAALDLDAERVNVKATTTERLGFEGRGEGIAAQAIASVKKGESD